MNNTTMLFNDNWEFAKSELGVSNSEQLNFEPVDLPHDWLIYDTLNLYQDGIGWYRKRFNCATGQRVFLYFEGVYMDSSVYLNGKFIGEWKYGYSSFEFEITDALIDGENEIIVKVIHQAPNSRWYSGAGIYRNVWLKTRGQNYIETDGIYISPKKTEQGWEVEVETELNLTDLVEVTHTILDRGEIIAKESQSVQPSDQQVIDHQKLFVKNPQLWSCDKPYLYRLVTELKTKDNQVLEIKGYNLGFREILLDPEQGLKVNGVKLKLNGVCEHHDLGALGAAFNKVALRRRFMLLKEMGVNAIRTAHNMPAKDFMNLADEMGFLVVSEAFDMWEHSKTKYDYGRFFPEWAARDVQSWVRRDRNHPSLLLWSIGNEIPDTHGSVRGQEITRMLMDYVHEHDPKHNARVTIGSNYMQWENAQKCADIVKVAGYNYAERLYDQHHQEHPDWIIYGSETSSVVQSRGVYHFPFEKPILVDADQQCSSLGNSAVSWGAKSAEYCIIAERDRPYSLGQFLWTGFDYIGEPTPYQTKNSYFGQLDTATFKKDSFYTYQAAWTDYQTNPMIHIFPYWDFNPGQIIDVRVATNAPKIELQLNGKTIGIQEIDHQHGEQLLGWWKVPYQVGELKAIAYDDQDNIIATDVRKSFGDPAKIQLKADKKRFSANGLDLIFLEITMEDELGNPVENASNRVSVSVKGEGRLLGLDNGDSTDYDQYKGFSRRLFNGKLMAIIGSTFESGEIEVEVSSLGLPSEIIKLESLRVERFDLIGISAHSHNQKRTSVTGSESEIPVRKIELHCAGERVLTPEKREIEVQAKLYPTNTSYHELEWQVINDTGIETPIANVTPIGTENKVKVTALGDGEFRLRCTSKNGTAEIKLMSHLEFKIEGLGPAHKDPYQFNLAGLYDFGSGELGSGNENGISTGRNQQTIIGFKALDFGKVGSDTITLPIFAFDNQPYAIKVWIGVPNEQGSELVGDLVYQKPSKWNVYQPETYQLNKQLEGLMDLYLVIEDRLQLKGFQFSKDNRAFRKNYAAGCDRIYGDDYQIIANYVEGIGNNVSLEFTELDFGEQGMTQLIVAGRTPLQKNSILVRFSGSEGEVTQVVEFAQTNEYQEQIFKLDQITGVQAVSFVFLPGSNFDFAWFQFK